MISFIFSPSIFFGMLAVLFIISMYAAFNVLLDSRKETAVQNELKRNIDNLEQENEKLKQNSALKEELYQGLKGQYDELEKDFEKIISQSQSIEPAAIKKIEEPASKPSIVDLLKSLNKTE